MSDSDEPLTDDERIWLALDRCVAGEASAADDALVRDWLAADASRAQIVTDLRRIRGAVLAPRSYQPAPAAWERLRQRVGSANIAPDRGSRISPVRDSGLSASARRMLAVAATVVITAGASTLFMHLRSASQAALISQRLHDDSSRTIATPRGRRSDIRLPDGTHVSLAPESRVTWLATADTLTRDVQLEGEAWLRIAGADEGQTVSRARAERRYPRRWHTLRRSSVRERPRRARRGHAWQRPGSRDERAGGIRVGGRRGHAQPNGRHRRDVKAHRRRHSPVQRVRARRDAVRAGVPLRSVIGELSAPGMTSTCAWRTVPSVTGARHGHLERSDPSRRVESVEHCSKPPRNANRSNRVVAGRLSATGRSRRKGRGGAHGHSERSPFSWEERVMIKGRRLCILCLAAFAVFGVQPALASQDDAMVAGRCSCRGGAPRLLIETKHGRQPVDVASMPLLRNRIHLNFAGTPVRDALAQVEGQGAIFA